MSDQDSFQRQVEAYLTWNFGANLWDIAFITFGLNLVSQTTIMPLLVSELTPSKVAIGLIPAVYSLGFLLPQLLTANHAERLRINKPFVMLLGGLGERLPYLLIGLVVLWLALPAPALTLVLLFLLLAVTATSNSMATPAWFSMIAKVIPVHRRGLWSGLARSLAALLGIAGGAFSGWLITNWSLPQNYGYSFTLLAPARTLAPILGGWLATWAGYRGMFFLALVVSLLGGLMMTAWVREPRRIQPTALAAKAAPEA